MKKMISTLSLVLVLCMSLTIGASAASYVPDDITYQNLNGQQMAIKIYTLLPNQNPADLMESDFEYDGYTYAYNSPSMKKLCTRKLSPSPPRRRIWKISSQP